MIAIILTALGFVCTLLLAYLYLLRCQELDDARGHVAGLQRSLSSETRRNDGLLRENNMMHAENIYLLRLNAQLMARNDYIHAENEEGVLG